MQLPKTAFRYGYVYFQEKGPSLSSLTINFC